MLTSPCGNCSSQKAWKVELISYFTPHTGRSPAGTTGDKLVTSDPVITSFLLCEIACITGDKLVINW